MGEAGAKFDLIINLPMRNKYRRPASYMTGGSRTRRMAVEIGGMCVARLPQSLFSTQCLF